MTATVSIRGVELAFDRDGAGPVFVWGHGLTSSRDREDQFPLIDWRQVRNVSDVVRYDARGHGDSGTSGERPAYGWDQLALDQLGLWDHLGIDRAVAGGASMGAATALHAAVMAPDRVDALVLVIPPTAWETRSGQTELYLQMAAVVETDGVEPLIAAGAEMAPPDPYLHDVGWRQRRADAMRQADPVRLATVFRGASAADLPAPDAVASIACPTLILAWSGDPGHPVSSAERLADLIEDSTVAIAQTAADLSTWTGRVAGFLRERT
jgi:pimeloyl-ACP methyl ester carboxylesterase